MITANEINELRAKAELLDLLFSATQDGIVDWCADLDTLLGRQAAGEAEHLSAIGLHWKVAQGSFVCRSRHVNRPAEDRIKAAGKHGVISCDIGPAPEHAICFAV